MSKWTCGCKAINPVGSGSCHSCGTYEQYAIFVTVSTTTAEEVSDNSNGKIKPEDSRWKFPVLSYIINKETEMRGRITAHVWNGCIPLYTIDWDSGEGTYGADAAYRMRWWYASEIEYHYDQEKKPIKEAIARVEKILGEIK